MCQVGRKSGAEEKVWLTFSESRYQMSTRWKETQVSCCYQGLDDDENCPSIQIWMAFLKSQESEKGNCRNAEEIPWSIMMLLNTEIPKKLIWNSGFLKLNLLLTFNFFVEKFTKFFIIYFASCVYVSLSCVIHFSNRTLIHVSNFYFIFELLSFILSRRVCVRETRRNPSKFHKFNEEWTHVYWKNLGENVEQDWRRARSKICESTKNKFQNSFNLSNKIYSIFHLIAFRFLSEVLVSVYLCAR